MHLNKRYKIGVFGTGGYYKKFENDIKEEIICFIDNDSKKIGSEIQGIKIIAADKLNELQYDYIVILSCFYNEIYNQLIKLKVDCKKIIIVPISNKEIKITEEVILFNNKIKNVKYEERKKIIKYYSCRRWESDLINQNFDTIDFIPKKKIIYDNANFRNIYEDFEITYNHKIDCTISLNKFLENEKYYLYLETPYAIFNYNHKNFNERHFIENIEADNLKGIIFLSEKCKREFYKEFQKYIENEYKFKDVIYPYINKFDERKKEKKSNEINLIYASYSFMLKGGRDLLEMMDNIDELDIKLKIITDINTIPEKYLCKIRKNKKIELINNNLTEKEIKSEIVKADILVHLTNHDSNAIVVLEALSIGIPVISNKMYAINEYIDDNINGKLIKCRYNMDAKVFETKNIRGDIEKNELNRESDDVPKKLYEAIKLINDNYETFKSNVVNKYGQSKYNDKITKFKWEKILGE